MASKEENEEPSVSWEMPNDESTFVINPIINFSIEQSEWCGYKGECKKNMVQAWDICFICKHLVKLDIPAMLDKAHKA